jgi:ribosomal-protein-alanine N-acetyltransferase
LGPQTCSILIEKTDRTFAGSAQYIFSEFCRQHWADTTWCNVGDDWEIPSLAWTKDSYRPAFRMNKWTVRPANRLGFALPLPAGLDQPASAPVPEPAVVRAGVDRANLADLDELESLESRSFAKPLALGRRQLRYLLRSERVSAHVIRDDGHIVAEAVLLRRKTPRGTVVRLYSLAVDQSRRGCGFGKLLLANCIDLARGEGAVAMVLEVDVENGPAINLYERYGFVKVHRLRDYYEPGHDGWKMRLDLKTRLLFPVEQLQPALATAGV